MSDTERNSAENQMYMCGKHHKLIDDQPNTYTVGVLTKMKANHEAWVKTALSEAMATVSFAEFDAICSHLLGTATEPVSDFSVTAPEDKIRRNGLTQETRFQVQIGLTLSKAVGHFVESQSQLDSAFAERLRSGFLAEYWRLRHEELDGDAIFVGLVRFAAGVPRSVPREAAAIAVVSYLFEACDIFEK